LHAIRLLKDKKDFTPDSLIAAAYDSYLPWFDKTIPALIKASDAAPVDRLAEQIRVLRAWDFRWAVDSVPTSLAIFWGEEIRRQVSTSAKAAGLSTEDFIAARVPPEQLLSALSAASDKLVADFGKWQTPWGEINRFQRLTGDIVQPFSDSAPSIPVGFASGNWGSLASFGAHAYPGTKKWYGTGGNSFVAVVEFGEKVHARAVTAGGESGHPTSPHFNDEAERYSTGNLREVYFYRSDLNGHTEREYHPGDSDKTIKVTNAAQVQSTRAALVKYIWGTSWADVAQKQPLGVEHNYSPKPEDAIPSGVENLKSIDKIDVSMGKVRSVAYVFYPDQKSLHKTVVLQQGHGCTLTDDGDKPVHLDLAIHKLVAAGYTVAALRMPNFQTPAACGPDGVHDKLFATPLKSGIAVQFFMEPVARTINYLVKHRPDLEEFDMVGLSGGGWTTTLYAALDPRVIKSFPVAGTLPLYLRGDHYNHDLEQYFNPLYKIAGYKDLYVLGAAGVGRMQVQILNRYDDCCFGENQHTVGPPSYLDSVREYEHDVQSTLRSMQSRGFSLHIDESAHYHQISPEAIEKVIIPVLNGEAPPAS
jgi:pimeloyl-ACP methyl ester carboxylesterase